MSKKQSPDGRILVVDDNKAILSALRLLLPSYFAEVTLLSSPNDLMHSIESKRPEVVLLDMNFTAKVTTGNEGLFWLGEIKKACPELPVVLFTAYSDVALAVDAIKRGAFDFVIKPFDNAKLLSTLQAALQLSRSRQEVKQLREIKNEIRSDGQMYWGDSPKMKELRSIVQKVARTDAGILITGENGTGKDMLAGEIHRMSRRSGSSMVCVDVGSLPEGLFESELFGHVKGAFTDARADRAGKFEVASGGTLFLDEIGNLPLHLQMKLLTAIQTKSVTRVGSNTPIPVDIRLICATNRDLAKMVASGAFREDLYFRINTIHLTLPPLRERPGDIVPLAQMFMRRYAVKYGKDVIDITEEALKALEACVWKGNIRELQHVVEKAVILADGDVLGRLCAAMTAICRRWPCSSASPVRLCTISFANMDCKRYCHGSWKSYSIRSAADCLGRSGCVAGYQRYVLGRRCCGCSCAVLDIQAHSAVHGQSPEAQLPAQRVRERRPDISFCGELLIS